MFSIRSLLLVSLSPLLPFFLAVTARAQDKEWVVYEGKDGPGKGKHIVLVSGDEEYRSEEALPLLGNILAKHHGFKCTVLFAVAKTDITKKDKKTGKVELISKAGEINPNVNNNIPGLEHLKTADLMILFTRFRNLPEDQMQHIVDYLDTGKPIIGIRTATHAFLGMSGKFAKYNNGAGVKGYEGGFGKQVFGDYWYTHHGGHGTQSARGIIAKDADMHPILKGIKDGDIWGPTDVYGVRKLPADAQPLVMGQVLVGMKSTDAPLKGDKNDPMMPLAWTRLLNEKTRVFTSTLGASEDLVADGSRRMFINAAYWCLGMESQIAPMSNVEIVGDFKASRFGNDRFKTGVRPSDLSIK